MKSGFFNLKNYYELVHPFLLLVMRRLGVRGFDALQFDCFHGVGNFLLLRLQSGQSTPLFQHDLVQLVKQVFQMRQMRFNFFQPFRQYFVHAGDFTLKKP